MKSATAMTLAIVLSVACAPSREAESAGSITKTYKRVPADAIQVKLEAGDTLPNAVLYVHDKTVHRIALGGVSESIGNLQAGGTVMWYDCGQEDGFPPYTVNHTCTVTQADKVTYHQNQPPEVEGAEQTHCFAFSDDKAMSCDEFERTRADRLARAQYRYEFKEAERRQDYAKFISTYAESDPDGLVAQARERQAELDGIQRQEQAERERQAQAAEEAAEREQLAIEQNAKQWRRTVKVGDDSHCGLVIEVKGPIVKVQGPAGESWLKLEQLYPPGGHRCRFVNSTYVP